MEYSLVISRAAKRDFDALDVPLRNRILTRLEWLASNSDQASHYRLQGAPNDLPLYRFRVGDYRVLYWKDDEARVLTVFRIRHRSVVYRDI